MKALKEDSLRAAHYSRKGNEENQDVIHVIGSYGSHPDSLHMDLSSSHVSRMRRGEIVGEGSDGRLYRELWIQLHIKYLNEMHVLVQVRSV